MRDRRQRAAAPLLHGYPQTHAMWHRIAPRLAERFTVVCSDLRGYGDSSKPEGGERSVNYSKRAMAADQVELMRALGFPRFRLAGHDRGGRVSHRLCVDHPEAVERVAVLDISPTRIMYGKTDKALATAYYHWFFLIQPFDLPEKLIGADPVLLPAEEDRRLGLGGEHLRSARLRRVRALFLEAGDDPRDVRGLSRRGVDRPRARRRRRCRRAQGDMPAARAVGRERRRAPLLRSRRRLADASRSTSAGARCRRGTTSPRRCPRRRWPSCRRSSAD